eukprot:TRINITY_DN2000_c0_g1_i1.p1 TRINITY_DN2000_c0_g1~~TRINITY_DN2000_c0_g1_i1.p1  ORF type:complete len:262 (+),score=59.76 TRINITY_DN2000_c0_g1_i1:383-1168(+)
MSQDIAADAVPIEEYDRKAHTASEISTEPTLAEHSEEESCCNRMENININRGDNPSEESLPMVEPMAESSDSNDSSGTESTVTEYQKAANKNSSNTESNNRQNQIQNQIIIQNPTGIVHLGPTYNISIGQAFTQVNANAAANNPSGNQANTNVPKATEVDDNTPSKEYMRPLWYSNRVIAGDELLRLSKNIGSNWKSVGNGLKFNWAQLDQFESDTKCLSDAVHRMLFRWLQWKDQKATVGRLTKVLFNHKEYDAIKCLTP